MAVAARSIAPSCICYHVYTKDVYSKSQRMHTGHFLHLLAQSLQQSRPSRACKNLERAHDLINVISHTFEVFAGVFDSFAPRRARRCQSPTLAVSWKVLGMTPAPAVVFHTVSLVSCEGLLHTVYSHSVAPGPRRTARLNAAVAGDASFGAVAVAVAPEHEDHSECPSSY